MVSEVGRQYSLDNIADVVRAINAAIVKKRGVELYDLCLVKPGSIPITTSGKVQRNACRKAYLTDSLQKVYAIVGNSQ